MLELCKKRVDRIRQCVEFGKRDMWKGVDNSLDAFRHQPNPFVISADGTQSTIEEGLTIPLHPSAPHRSLLGQPSHVASSSSSHPVSISLISLISLLSLSPSIIRIPTMINSSQHDDDDSHDTRLRWDEQRRR